MAQVPLLAACWALCLAMAACGNATEPLQPASGQTITILNYTFSPQRVQVAPGSALLIRNDDPVAHTVTSAAAAGTYTFGAVGGISFDTPPFTGTMVLNIPATAPVGTVIPYFCRIDGAAMLNQPEVEIVAP